MLYIPAFGQNSSDQDIYIINSYNYHVEGVTKDYALDYAAGFKTGEEITGLSNLEKFLRAKTQLLENERLFESVRIEHTIGQQLRSGKYPVDLDIFIKDSWNIIIFPYPEYSSNTGFEFTLKVREQNFFGTMAPAKFDLGYHHDEEGNNSYRLMFDTGIPFRALGLYWRFDFDNDLQYKPDLSQQWYYKNTTGISVEFPAGRTTITAGFAESFFINQEIPLKYREEYGRFQEGFYLSSNPYVSWKIPTGLSINNSGDLIYTPSISAVFNHELEPLADFLKGPFFTFSHTLNFGRVDWVDNFRSGTSVSIGNSFTYNLFNQKNDIQPWAADFSVSGEGHFVINENIGFSSRLLYRQWLFDEYGESCGDALRGILDNDIEAKYMLSLSIDVTFLILKIRPSQRFGSSGLWRILDLDFHLAPIIDAAFYSSPDNANKFSPENYQLTAGFEFFIFPVSWRSLLLRISYGRNFSFGPQKSRSELFIGTEFHY